MFLCTLWQVARLAGHTAPVLQLLAFGDSLLLSLGADGALLLWPLVPPSAAASPPAPSEAAGHANGVPGERADQGQDEEGEEGAQGGAVQVGKRRGKRSREDKRRVSGGGSGGGGGRRRGIVDVEPLGRVELPPGFTPTCFMHPDTYLNKVLSPISIKYLCFFSWY